MTPPARRLRAVARALALAGLLSACGGGTVSNVPLTGGQTLSFAYFQQNVYPIFVTPLPIVLNGVTVVNSCAAAGCHNSATGTGGAFRIIPGAQTVNLSDPANTPDVIRASDMYKNFYSAQGETVIGSPSQSLLLNKPLVNNVLHGGGVVFASAADPNAKTICTWISNPMPAGQSEFGTPSIAPCP